MVVSDQSGFVLTHWPGDPVPIPPVAVPDVEVVPAQVRMWDSFGEDIKEHEEWSALLASQQLQFTQKKEAWFLDTHLLVFGVFERGVRNAAIPDELYLRSFLDLDVKSAEAVGEFCAAFGPVGLRTRSTGAGRCPRPRDWPYDLGGFDLWVELLRQKPLLQLECWVNSAIQTWKLRPDGLHVKGQSTAQFASTWGARWFGEVEIYQSFLRDMRNSWDFLCGGRSFASLREDWTSGKWDWSLEEPRSGHDETRVTQWALTSGLNPALSVYTVRIQVFNPEDWPWGVPEPWESDSVYSAMCLQLTNQIAKKIPYRRCKNERCGRLFAVKTGPDRDWHRTRGVLHYCSDECANRQTQREHRRRKRDARRSATEALGAGTAPANDDEGGSDDDTT